MDTSLSNAETLPANETMLALQMVQDLKLAEQVRQPLQDLYHKAHESVGTVNYLGRRPARWSSLQNSRELTQLIHVFSGTLLGMNVDELLELPTQNSSRERRRIWSTVEAGDTLAVYVESILPAKGQPLPVMQAGKRNPVTGYPVPVSSSGEIVLPIVGRIKVADRDVSAVRENIENAYLEKKILSSAIVSVDVLSKANSGEEIRALTTAAPASAGTEK